MLKREVSLGKVYIAKLSGKLVDVRLDSLSPHGGWEATNLFSGRPIRIKSAAKLHREKGLQNVAYVDADGGPLCP